MEEGWANSFLQPPHSAWGPAQSPGLVKAKEGMDGWMGGWMSGWMACLNCRHKEGGRNRECCLLSAFRMLNNLYILYERSPKINQVERNNSVQQGIEWSIFCVRKKKERQCEYTFVLVAQANSRQLKKPVRELGENKKVGG